MTAYTNRDISLVGAIARWEIRSVNHRYLELSFKLPEPLRDLEYILRGLSRNQLSRGKVECSLKLEWLEEKPSELTIDYKLVEVLTEVAEKIMQRLPSGNACMLSPFDILRWPAVVRIPDKDISQLIEPLQQSFSLVLQDLVNARAREGAALQVFIEEKLIKMRLHIDRINQRLPEIQKGFRTKFFEKLRVLQQEVDVNRFEQEMAYLIQKMDISEELDRLTIHTIEVARILKSDQVIGRRLDFLMQELNREANTIASKAIDNETIQDSVELKVLIEEMREQIQNLE